MGSIEGGCSSPYEFEYLRCPKKTKKQEEIEKIVEKNQEKRKATPNAKSRCM